MSTLRKVKGSDYSFTGKGEKDCYFMEMSNGYGDYNTICLVNGYKKTVSPIHGYYFPNPCSNSIRNLANKLGYKYEDPVYNNAFKK